jgi:hypothetical protein
VENEALCISITAEKTVLQRLHAENAAMRAQLGENMKVRPWICCEVGMRNCPLNLRTVAAVPHSNGPGAP